MKSPLESALAGSESYSDPAQFDKLRSHLPAAVITKALAEHGKQARRRARLSPEAVVWLIIAMALFRSEPIEQIVARLNLARPGRRGSTVSPGTIPAARDRLGEQPMQSVFKAVAPEAAHAHAQDPANRWRGLALYGIDGSTSRVADTPENRAEFGGHRGRKGSGESGYPLVRIVALMALASHLIADAAFGPFNVGEITYARELLDAIPSESLTIIDRGFLGAAMLITLQRGGTERHWLVRAKSNTRWRVVRRFGRGDWLVEMTVRSEARKKDPTLPRTFQARVVSYRRKGFRPQKLITSLLDPEKYPATELALVYHRRWEIELGFGEIKTTMLEKAVTLRSKKPSGVRQEIWGVLLAYHLVRSEMQQVARSAKVDATRISFLTMLRRIRDAWFWWVVSEGDPMPKLMQQLWDELAGLILPPRRSDRRYPRAVKIKMSKFNRKRPVVQKPNGVAKKAA